MGPLKKQIQSSTICVLSYRTTSSFYSADISQLFQILSGWARLLLPPPFHIVFFFFLHNTVGGAKPKHMTLGTGHWCVAMVYETLSPQINARCKEEKEVEKRMAGSHHCQPSRSPYRTKGGRAVCSSEENWWEEIDHPDERISLDVKKSSLLFLEENPTFEKAESPNV